VLNKKPYIKNNKTTTSKKTKQRPLAVKASVSAKNQKNDGAKKPMPKTLPENSRKRLLLTKKTKLKRWKRVLKKKRWKRFKKHTLARQRLKRRVFCRTKRNKLVKKNIRKKLRFLRSPRIRAIARIALLSNRRPIMFNKIAIASYARTSKVVFLPPARQSKSSPFFTPTKRWLFAAAEHVAVARQSPYLQHFRNFARRFVVARFVNSSANRAPLLSSLRASKFPFFIRAAVEKSRSILKHRRVFSAVPAIALSISAALERRRRVTKSLLNSDLGQNLNVLHRLARKRAVRPRLNPHKARDWRKFLQRRANFNFSQKNNFKQHYTAATDNKPAHAIHARCRVARKVLLLQNRILRFTRREKRRCRPSLKKLIRLLSVFRWFRFKYYATQLRQNFFKQKTKTIKKVEVRRFPYQKQSRRKLKKKSRFTRRKRSVGSLISRAIVRSFKKMHLSATYLKTRARNTQPRVLICQQNFLLKNRLFASMGGAQRKTIAPRFFRRKQLKRLRKAVYYALDEQEEAEDLNLSDEPEPYEPEAWPEQNIARVWNKSPFRIRPSRNIKPWLRAEVFRKKRYFLNARKVRDFKLFRKHTLLRYSQYTPCSRKHVCSFAVLLQRTFNKSRFLHAPVRRFIVKKFNKKYLKRALSGPCRWKKSVNRPYFSTNTRSAFLKRPALLVYSRTLLPKFRALEHVNSASSDRRRISKKAQTTQLYNALTYRTFARLQNRCDERQRELFDQGDLRFAYFLKMRKFSGSRRRMLDAVQKSFRFPTGTSGIDKKHKKVYDIETSINAKNAKSYKRVAYPAAMGYLRPTIVRSNIKAMRRAVAMLHKSSLQLSKVTIQRESKPLSFTFKKKDTRLARSFKHQFSKERVKTAFTRLAPRSFAVKFISAAPRVLKTRTMLECPPRLIGSARTQNTFDAFLRKEYERILNLHYKRSPTTRFLNEGLQYSRASVSVFSGRLRFSSAQAKKNTKNYKSIFARRPATNKQKTATRNGKFAFVKGFHQALQKIATPAQVFEFFNEPDTSAEVVLLAALNKRLEDRKLQNLLHKGEKNQIAQLEFSHFWETSMDSASNNHRDEENENNEDELVEKENASNENPELETETNEHTLLEDEDSYAVADGEPWVRDSEYDDVLFAWESSAQAAAFTPWQQSLRALSLLERTTEIEYTKKQLEKHGDNFLKNVLIPQTHQLQLSLRTAQRQLRSLRRVFSRFRRVHWKLVKKYEMGPFMQLELAVRKRRQALRRALKSTTLRRQLVLHTLKKHITVFENAKKKKKKAEQRFQKTTVVTPLHFKQPKDFVPYSFEDNQKWEEQVRVQQKQQYRQASRFADAVTAFFPALLSTLLDFSSTPITKQNACRAITAAYWNCRLRFENQFSDSNDISFQTYAKPLALVEREIAEMAFQRQFTENHFRHIKYRLQPYTLLEEESLEPGAERWLWQFMPVFYDLFLENPEKYKHLVLSPIKIFRSHLSNTTRADWKTRNNSSTVEQQYKRLTQGPYAQQSTRFETLLVTSRRAPFTSGCGENVKTKFQTKIGATPVKPSFFRRGFSSISSYVRRTNQISCKASRVTSQDTSKQTFHRERSVEYTATGVLISDFSENAAFASVFETRQRSPRSQNFVARLPCTQTIVTNRNGGFFASLTDNVVVAINNSRPLPAHMFSIPTIVQKGRKEGQFRRAPTAKKSVQLQKLQNFSVNTNQRLELTIIGHSAFVKREQVTVENKQPLCEQNVLQLRFGEQKTEKTPFLLTPILPRPDIQVKRAIRVFSRRQHLDQRFSRRRVRAFRGPRWGFWLQEYAKKKKAKRRLFRRTKKYKKRLDVLYAKKRGWAPKKSRRRKNWQNKTKDRRTKRLQLNKKVCWSFLGHKPLVKHLVLSARNTAAYANLAGLNGRCTRRARSTVLPFNLQKNIVTNFELRREKRALLATNIEKTESRETFSPWAVLRHELWYLITSLPMKKVRALRTWLKIFKLALKSGVDWSFEGKPVILDAEFKTFRIRIRQTQWKKSDGRFEHDRLASKLTLNIDEQEAAPWLEPLLYARSLYSTLRPDIRREHLSADAKSKRWLQWLRQHYLNEPSTHQYVRRRSWPKIRMYIQRMHRSLFKLPDTTAAVKRFQKLSRKRTNARGLSAFTQGFFDRIDVILVQLEIAPTVYWAREMTKMGIIKINGNLNYNPQARLSPGDSFEWDQGAFAKTQAYFVSSLKEDDENKMLSMSSLSFPDNFKCFAKLRRVYYLRHPSHRDLENCSRIDGDTFNAFRLDSAIGF
jgi:hypothetical protein